MLRSKTDILQAIDQKKKLAIEEQFDDIVNQYDELILQIKQNQYDVVITGEFNHGKSTFVNALLGESLLPMGITPTTAILHKIVYGEQKAITIFYKDGNSSKLAWDNNVLFQFIANQQTKIDNIDFIQIEAPMKMLEDRVCIIDTPGLNDINELRADITYNYMPKADIVFFMLSAHMALRKSEINFIKQQVKLGGMQLVFILNMMDAVDDEELQEVIASVKARLSQWIDNPTVIELSALDALEGLEQQDEELFEDSNLPAIQQLMMDIFSNGQRMELKMRRYHLRFEQINEAFMNQIEMREYALTKNQEQLEQELESILLQKKQLPSLQIQLNEYLDQCELQYFQMIEESSNLLFSNIERKVLIDLEKLQGSAIEHYITNSMPLFLRQELVNWSYQNTPMLHTIVDKISKEITRELSEQFNKDLKFPLIYQPLLVEEAIQPISVNGMEYKTVDSTIRSGLIAGGAGALLVAAGASVFMPIVAFAGMPLLKKFFEKNHSEQLRQSVMGQLKMELFQTKQAFLKTVETYMNNLLIQLQQQTINMVETQLNQLISTIEMELMNISQKQNDQSKQKRLISNSKTV